MYLTDSLVMTVAQLNNYVKGLIETDGQLRSVFVAGEISNFVNHYKSGHFYLSLKDENAVIKAVMFRSYAQKVPFDLQNGMRVICRGRVAVYERDGVYQLYIDQIQPDGVGALKIAFDQMTKRLQDEGLFDEAHKKPIPRYPSRIAVITSPTGAAIQDILNILGRRMPAVEVLMYPVLVQGEFAAEQLRAAVKAVNDDKSADVIVIGRGGGSIEDLWAFNDEQLARAIYASVIPVISAVGHETDFTICDFVSDLRAPTPSAAAELAVPDVSDVLKLIGRLNRSAASAVKNRISQSENELKRLAENRVLRSPVSYIDSLYETFDRVCTSYKRVAESVVEEHSQKLRIIAAKLDAYSPLKTLSRGYSIAYKGDDILRSVNGLSQNDRLKIKLQDGSAECVVTSVSEG